MRLIRSTTFNPILRLRILTLFFILCFSMVIARLFYWQVLAGEKLHALAEIQRDHTMVVPAPRGQILASDNFPLVTNQPAYLLYAYTPDLEVEADVLSNALKDLLAPTAKELGATPSAQLTLALSQATEASLEAKLSNPKSSWIPLHRQLNKTTHDAINSLGFKGLGFDEYQMREYPEASMAAQLLGFIGSDGTGNPKGYFGLEGYYNLELTGKPGLIKQETDASGRPIIIGDYQAIATRPGRTIKTHINRSLQLIIESELAKGLQKYDALSGEISIMNPKTGAVIGLAASPSYDPQYYKLYPSLLQKIPAITDTFEPGSIFKPIVMAAAINEGLINADTTCDSTCNGPVTIGKYTIRTWNDQYYPNQTMTDVLKHSDNTGMIYVANLLGKDKFEQYLSDFGFGQGTLIDLESESIPVLRSKWGDIDLATGSFGQGIAITSMQMLQAMGALANQGLLMQPQVVDQVITENEVMDIKPKAVRQVVTPDTAKMITQMLVQSAQKGEAQWAFADGSFQIAGKTGTAQIPIQGHYDTEKTIASFVGFAPASDPQFVMLVKLREPKTSPWASETAAPLWLSVAKLIMDQHLIDPSP